MLASTSYEIDWYLQVSFMLKMNYSQ